MSSIFVHFGLTFGEKWRRYNLDVSLTDIPAHTQAGWLAANVMGVPEISVPTAGRLPATPTNFTVSLNCVTEGKARMTFAFTVCEDAAGAI